MELFIRSQDKTRLFKFDDLKIECTCEEMPSCGSYKICDVCEDIIAIYKTKERALEVLDEIHQRLIDLQTLELTNDYRFAGKRNLNCVYQMPKE